MLGRLRCQHVSLSLGAVKPEHANQGRLAGGSVLADRLADFLLGASGVEHIVGNLKGRAQIAPICGNLMALMRG